MEKELRIGNYVFNREGELLRIDWWESVNKVVMKMFVGGMFVHPRKEYAEKLKPIPLTEEWLEKFGFEKGIGEVFNFDRQRLGHHSKLLLECFLSDGRECCKEI